MLIDAPRVFTTPLPSCPVWVDPAVPEPSHGQCPAESLAGCCLLACDAALIGCGRQVACGCSLINLRALPDQLQTMGHLLLLRELRARGFEAAAGRTQRT
jgi:hypothetical protein